MVIEDFSIVKIKDKNDICNTQQYTIGNYQENIKTSKNVNMENIEPNFIFYKMK